MRSIADMHVGHIRYTLDAGLIMACFELGYTVVGWWLFCVLILCLLLDPRR